MKPSSAGDYLPPRPLPERGKGKHPRLARIGGGGHLTQTFDALQEPAFLEFWLGMLGSYTAQQMQQVARGYLAYALTGSGTALGIVTLAWGLPQLLFSPFAGVVADRLPKRELLIVTQALLFAGTLVNALLISAGVIELWHLVLISFAQGTAFTFNMPARQALVSTLVAPGRIGNAVALNNAGMNFTRIVGPALAGVLISIPMIGTAGTFYVMAACYFFTAAMLFRLPRGASGTHGGPMFRQMLDGFRYIRGSPSLRSLLLTAVAVILLGIPFQTLMPLFALRVYQAGPAGLGLLNAMAGVGALAGSLAVAYFSASPRKRQAQILLGICFGLALVLFALSPWFPLAVVAMFAVGVTSNSYLALNNTQMLTNSEPAMHGRLSAAYNMIWGTMPVASLPMSMAADVIGAPLTLAAAGALTAAAVIALNAGAILGIAPREPDRLRGN
ncbi:MAG: MFS transporter [Chloroflexota bacterium]